MIQALLGLVPSLIKGGFGYVKKKQEIKKLKASAEAKLKINRETNDHQVKLTDAEWEALSQQGLADSWKDEYVTIVITAPIPFVLVGAVWEAFTGNDRLLVGTLNGIEKLTALGLDWDFLTMAVVMAAIGLKIWRKA